MTHSKKYPPLDDLEVWSIVRFFIRRAARRRGIGRALLEAAVAYAREHDAAGVEANAVAPGGKIAPPEAYHGTVSMFERAGFRRAREVPTTGVHERWVMRLEFD